jgi:hypothetical protein
LTVGLHHYPDVQSIEEDTVRVAVERKCLMLGQRLLKAWLTTRDALRYSSDDQDKREACGDVSVGCSSPDSEGLPNSGVDASSGSSSDRLAVGQCEGCEVVSSIEQVVVWIQQACNGWVMTGN